jgi:hypothetical protein
MDLGPAGQFTAYKKKPLDHVRPKLSSKSHVFQSLKGSRCIAQFTAIRLALSTTINRGCLIGVPHLIVAASQALGKPAYAKIAAAVVLSFSKTRTRHFVVAWESFRSPAPTPLRAFTAN